MPRRCTATTTFDSNAQAGTDINSIEILVISGPSEFFEGPNFTSHELIPLQYTCSQKPQLAPIQVHPEIFRASSLVYIDRPNANITAVQTELREFCAVSF